MNPHPPVSTHELHDTPGFHRQGYRSNIFLSTFRRGNVDMLVIIKRLRITPTAIVKRVGNTQYNSCYAKWKELDHPNLTKYLDFFDDAAHLPGLLRPYYVNGNIVEYYAKNPESRITQLQLSDTVAGLDYLHSRSIIHGSVQGSKIQIDPAGHALLVDFDLHQIMGHGLDYGEWNDPFCFWNAPELVVSMNEDGALRTKEGDVYSFGMTIIEIFTQERPFHRLRNTRMFHMAMREDLELAKTILRPQFIPEVLWMVFKRCCYAVREERPTSRVVHSLL
ncbi:hypothetical protein JAAARDRAFT_193564 [Jaapia argillacea MUCL 33604]|uniref:Protein kinase domain-containing protein n=1 Tax=Jaapia argillacea MUCL 33604 TaxID=933084 RepID=A0A067PTF9_9AGAM|nr:hypothetical protein JAAARDRAFT_193564 [Jaapia argillacea MUCL 33604]